MIFGFIRFRAAYKDLNGVWKLCGPEFNNFEDANVYVNRTFYGWENDRATIIQYSKEEAAHALIRAWNSPPAPKPIEGSEQQEERKKREERRRWEFYRWMVSTKRLNEGPEGDYVDTRTPPSASE